MKFDYVIGNPPFQTETTQKESKTNRQKPSKNIFHKFQIEAEKVTSSGTVLIYPGGRWIHRSGKGLKDFGLKQINDKKLKSLIFYPDTSEVFPNIEMSDGISIVVKDMKKKEEGFNYTYIHNGKEQHRFCKNPGKNLLVFNPDDLDIDVKISKFVEDNKLKYLNDAILPRSLFNIESDFTYKYPDKVRPFEENYNYPEEIKLFTNHKPGKAGRAKWFIVDRDTISKNQNMIDEWQVVVSSASPAGKKRDNQIQIIDNHSAFGRVRVALRSFKTQKEAENFLKYMNSTVVKYAFLLSEESLTSLGMKVPDLGDYTDNNQLIDFNQNIDLQLSKLIDLNDKELSIMKNKIKNIR